jgi:hypothetical protein
MRKIHLYLILAVLLALAQGCSLKHSLGYVNNELAWRQSFGDMKTELSLGGGTLNNFSDGVTDANGIYTSTETGRIQTDISLGLAYYYRVFKNDIFDISAGLKFRNYFRFDYNYTYYYQNYSIVRHYNYNESLDFGFFNSNRVSVMFPDAEIKCPFSDNLKFTLSVELVYVKWRYNGGNHLYNFWQDVSTNTGYHEGGSDKTNGPGAAYGLKGGSEMFSIGGINAGLLYYF